MHDDFALYFEEVLKEWPPYVGVIFAIYIIIAITLGILKNRRVGYGILMCGYCLLLLHFTVFSRTTGQIVKYSLYPFYSYYDIAKGNYSLFPQVLMNVLLFIPFGFFVKGTFSKWNWKRVLIVGVLLSITIEVLQFLLKRGVAELDDIIHNTFGCALGILLYEVARATKEYIIRNHQHPSV